MHALPDCLRVSIPNNMSLRWRSGQFSPVPCLKPPPPQQRGARVPTYARKGDGKQRRPKSDADKKLAESGQNGVAPSPPPPPRVDVNSLIEMRKQIRIAKEIKQIEASAFRRKPPVFNTYRKESKEPEEYRQERAAAEAITAELSKNESKNFALSKLYKTAESTTTTKLGLSATSVNVLPPPVLLVDGYNVLHKWDRTASLMADGNQMDAARDILIEALGVYSHTNGVRVIVAFDAMNGSTTGIDEQILSTGITVAYTGNCEADSFIEAQVDVWLQWRHPYVVVATSDIAQKAVVDSKTGPDKRQIVFVVPASGLCKDIEATEKRLEQQLRDLEMRPVARGILGSAVKFKNQSTFSTMQRMRMSMPTASTLPNMKLKSTNGNGQQREKPAVVVDEAPRKLLKIENPQY